MPPDRQLLAVAARQHGAISALQLSELGLTRHQIAHRVSTGWLRRLHRGVYLVGPLETAHTQAIAAVLAAGRGALLAHYPAAVAWGLRPAREGPMHVTLAHGAHTRPGIRIHRATLHPNDVTRRHGIPVTSAARTLLDLAATELDRALNEARVNRLVSDPSRNEQFSHYPKHPGTAALKEAIQTDPAFTRSEAERRALELIRRARLPAPDTNAQLHGHEVDLLWREQRLIAEIDGYTYPPQRATA
jgi:Transcriptional regulator, AbiEi antitoxin